MIELTDRQLEDLESLTVMPGWKIIDVYITDLKDKTLKANSNAKNRDLISPDYVIHETAVEVMRENNGKLKGAQDLIEFIESAREKRLKRKVTDGKK